MPSIDPTTVTTLPFSNPRASAPTGDGTGGAGCTHGASCPMHSSTAQADDGAKQAGSDPTPAGPADHASAASKLLEQLRADSVYVVQDGEWLSSIAAKLGVSTEELYALNRDVIGPDPDRIEPGMELLIPGSPLATLVASSGTAAEEDDVDDDSGDVVATDGPDGAPEAEETDEAPVAGGDTGVSAEAVAQAKADSRSAEGLVPQARRNLERAWEYGLRLNGGVGDWNEWHADGSSVDVSNWTPDVGFNETPELRAYVDEMYELGRSGATGADGGLLVTHVVYAGMRAGASTNWQWEPVSLPNDITEGHWDHAHIETDSWV